MTENFILCLIAIAGGIILAVVGLILLAQKGNGATSIHIPWFGEIETRHPALAVVFISALLIIYPIYLFFKVPEPVPLIPIKGAVKLTLPSSSQDQIAVYLVPNRYKTITDSKGTCEFDVEQGGQPYSALACYRTQNDNIFKSVGVDISQDNKRGEFKLELP